MIRLCILVLIASAAFYYKGWNIGYDVGYMDKQSDEILRGNVVCRYKVKPH